MSASRPNLVYILPDQVRASALRLYGEPNLTTPNIDRLARDGVVVRNALSTCPVCSPYRSMLLTGRHPQTTGHVINFVRTRNDEIGLGDVFGRAGYRTGWVGKWHLHTGSFPEIQGKDYVPEGRDRLGFDFWRGYNFHQNYFDGHVNRDGWRNEQWQGYETRALAGYAREFIDGAGEEPFCLFVSPHQCHRTPFEFAPQDCYDRVPETLVLPENVPEASRAAATEMYRHYLAMLVAVDDMVGEILDHLDTRGLAENTIVVFTSDHGTQMGAHGLWPWEKRLPWEESISVPWIMRWPSRFGPGERDVLLAPADVLPSLCGLCDIPIPRTVEGIDLSAALLGLPDAPRQEDVLTMCFSTNPDYIENGSEWRGVRSRQYSYARWRDGRAFLYDIEKDPLQLHDLRAERPDLVAAFEARLQFHLERRGDAFGPCEDYASWFDANRRVVRNAFGPLGNPEDGPDWSLLR